jgi:hypothetical protein
MKITEGVAGLWHYHLSKDDSKSRALCGSQVMDTAMPLGDWKVPFGEHFPKRPTFCEECDKLKEKA